MKNAIELKGINKKFGEFYANKNISLTVASGTIHAIVGENGAGKSTLMNILYGLYKPDSGEIMVKGEPAVIQSPTDAITRGIGMVHQHFMLIPTLTVAENIILGDEKAEKGWRIPFGKINAEIKTLSEQFGLEIDPSAKISTLSVGLEQRVEILKVLYRKAEILILDEPTAVLTPIETEQLFGTLRSLRKEGKTIIIITHKLEEVLALSDRVSVMRQGQLVDTLPTKEATKELLARMMVGRDVLLSVSKSEAAPKEEVLSLRQVGYTNAKGVQMLKDLSLTVRAGEIYGLAGVEGNGQSEILKLLWGLLEPGDKVTGDVLLSGEKLLGKTPKDIAALGVSHIPEDRLKYAVIKDFSIADNLIFGRHYELEFNAAIGFNTGQVKSYAADMIQSYDVRSASGVSEAARIGTLSGGNQQKVVVARELTRPGMKLLILAQPTRGVDIGAIEFIHRKIVEARDKGIAVLLISAELEEILSLSDRIGCLYKGTLRHEFSQADVLQGHLHPEEFEKQIGFYIT
ncbi:MAG: ABC transporter ATP-binding protein [Chlorobiales bacterium]|nr:ABC transporter ATP-binding protein [Chlorobiales bacterium]